MILDNSLTLLLSPRHRTGSNILGLASGDDRLIREPDSRHRVGHHAVGMVAADAAGIVGVLLVDVDELPIRVVDELVKLVVAFFRFDDDLAGVIRLAELAQHDVFGIAGHDARLYGSRPPIGVELLAAVNAAVLQFVQPLEEAARDAAFMLPNQKRIMVQIRKEFAELDARFRELARVLRAGDVLGHLFAPRGEDGGDAVRAAIGGHALADVAADDVARLDDGPALLVDEAPCAERTLRVRDEDGFSVGIFG